MRITLRPASRWFGLILLLELGLHASIASAVTPRWKFQKGESLQYVLDQKTVTEVSGIPQEVKSTMSQTIDLRWMVRDVDAEGKASLAQSISRVRTRIESPVGAFEFDSNAEKDPAGPAGAVLGPLLRSLVGTEFLFKMSPRGEISDIKVPEKVVEAIKKTGPLGGGAGMFSEDGMKNMISEMGLTLPNEDLNKGKEWSSESKTSMPQVGVLSRTKTYQYQGAEAKDAKSLERIDQTTKVVMQPDPKSNVDIKINEQKSEGRFYFDNARGYINESNLSENIKMTFKIKIGDVEQDVTQGNESTTVLKLVKASDAEPSK